mmetsp:Transcript_62080/g.138312  ORF Transcript_62080/g.138312 Transcript_62080/m.138312 type:complete len:267 (+) Transcript_62080:317-1117(+)
MHMHTIAAACTQRSLHQPAAPTSFACMQCPPHAVLAVLAAPPPSAAQWCPASPASCSPTSPAASLSAVPAAPSPPAASATPTTLRLLMQHPYMFAVPLSTAFPPSSSRGASQCARLYLRSKAACAYNAIPTCSAVPLLACLQLHLYLQRFPPCTCVALPLPAATPPLYLCSASAAPTADSTTPAHHTFSTSRAAGSKSAATQRLRLRYRSLHCCMSRRFPAVFGCGIDPCTVVAIVPAGTVPTLLASTRRLHLLCCCAVQRHTAGV